MSQLKKILPITQELSLLYIDEDINYLLNITTELKKVFAKVDDASDATTQCEIFEPNCDVQETFFDSGQENVGFRLVMKPVGG